jgi:hypothetical protein
MNISSRQTRPKAGHSIQGVLIYLALVGLAFAVNYPGRLNPDSIDQLTQAVHPALLNDWHEPWTIGYWRLFSPLAGEPAGALLAQSLALLVYPSLLISRAIASGRRSAPYWIFLAIFTISVVEVAGQIVKDAMLLGFILCFLALLDIAEFGKRRRQKMLFALPLAIAASLIRPVNAFLFGFPAALALLARRTRWRVALPALLFILAACAIQVPFVKFLDGRLLKAAHGNAESSVIIFDVAGISTMSHSDLFATIPGWPTHALARPWDCYTPYQWDPFRWGKCGRYFELFDTYVSNRYAFWAHAILAHPLAYMLHRARYAFQSFRSAAPVATFHMPYAINTAATRSAMFSTFTHGIDMRGQFQLWHPNIASRIAEWIAAIVFSKPAGLVEMAACFLVLWFGIRKKHGLADTVGFAAAGIGIANILLMVMFGVAAEGRYFLPTYVCGLLILMRAADRWQKRLRTVDAELPRTDGPAGGLRDGLL